MSRDSAPASASRTGERHRRTTRRGLLSIPPLVAFASMMVARPAQASTGTVECLADLGTL